MKDDIIRTPKLIKYQELGRSLSSPGDISFDDDRAVTDFRAFHAIAHLHTSRVKDVRAIDVMEEVLGNLLNNLQTRRNVLS